MPDKTMPTLKDYFLVAPIVLAGTINLWKIETLRSLVPIDLTALGLASSAIIILFTYASSGRKIPAAGKFWKLLICFLPGVALSKFDQPYAISKTESLFTIIPLITLASACVINSKRRIQAFQVTISLIAAILAIAIEFYGTASLDNPGRTGLEDANVIGLGRMYSLGVVAFLTLTPRILTRYISVPCALLCLHAAVLTGSRGPLLGAALGLAFVLLISARDKNLLKQRVRRLIVPATTGLFALWYFARGSRLTSAFGSDSDTSRADLALSSLQIFARHPWGIGWGELAQYLPLGVRIDSQGWAQYPHDVLIECAAEGGAIAALALLVFWWTCTKALIPQGRDGQWAPFAMSVATIVAAMTSSDITGNRAMWMMLGVGIAFLPSTKSRYRSNLLKKSATKR